MVKNGVFYTITALLLLAVFLFAFLSITKYTYSTKGLVVETRVNTINDFIIDVEKDVERATYITSFRALLSLGQKVVTSGSFVDDINLRFNELFFNATYNGENITMMQNNEFVIWENKIKEKAGELDIEILFANESVRISHQNPWNIKTELNFTMIIGDIKKTAYFTKYFTITSSVPINLFEDPTYRINTNGLVLRAINIENNTYFVAGNDTTNLLLHINDSRYIAFSGAPSYLKRLEGDLTADPNGIESLVNIDELSAQGINTSSKTIVDYIYFSSNNPQSYMINGMDSWFRLDNESDGSTTHLQLYQVEDMTE